MPAKKTTKRKTETVEDGDKNPKKVKGKLCTFMTDIFAFAL